MTISEFPLFNPITVCVVFAATGALWVAGGLSRQSMQLIVNLTHPLMLSFALIGLVQMLTALNDPAALGPALAVALAPIIWGLLIGGVLGPFSANYGGANSSLALQLAGSVLLFLVLAWCIMMGSAPRTFFNLEAGILVFGGVLMFSAIDALRGITPEGAWSPRLLGIGAVGFTSGLIAGLPYLTEPRGLGPALALSLLSLLYSLVLLCFARIWSPTRLLDTSGNMATGFQTLVLPTLFGISLAMALVAATLSGIM